MKTIKEMIAPAFQEVGRLTKDRRFYEACSKPMFVLPRAALLREIDDYNASLDALLQAGSAPAKLPSRRLPYRECVLVLESESAPKLDVFYLVTDCGEWRGKVLNMFFRDGVWRVVQSRDFGVPGILVDGDTEFYAAMLAVVIGFARMFENPGLHVATVAPVNAEKRVEWTKAQEHFVFLGRDHPVNTAGAAAEASYDESQVIKRMAHYVRAHDRMLRSPRFRFKQGQTVRVREQWRGPKEWVNKRSRQIYRWVDKKVFSAGEAAA